jgi:choline dehydrogenase
MGTRLHEFSGFTVSACQLRPESRGSVRISGMRLSPSLRIDPNYLATEFDRNVTVAGLRLVRRIMASPAIARYVSEEIAPGALLSSAEELLEHCQQFGASLYHPVGTARMGIDRLAVVDSQLRVHGLEGLRIVDGSVMPTVLSGNTHAGIVMIAEKASDLILDDAGRGVGTRSN